jgi:hypothetical protein
MMNNKMLWTSACLWLLFRSAGAQDLHFYGQIRDYDTREFLTSARVVVEVNGKRFTSQNCNSSGKYDFVLPLGEDYWICYKRKRYFGKIVRIDTRNIPDSASAGGFDMKLDGTLIRRKKGVDPSVFEMPMAISSYSQTYDGFMFDFAYTESRQKEIEKVLSEARGRKGRSRHFQPD